VFHNELQRITTCTTSKTFINTFIGPITSENLTDFWPSGQRNQWPGMAEISGPLASDLYNLHLHDPIWKRWSSEKYIPGQFLLQAPPVTLDYDLLLELLLAYT